MGQLPHLGLQASRTGIYQRVSLLRLNSRGSWSQPVLMLVPTQGSSLCWSLKMALKALNWRQLGFPARAEALTWCLQRSCGEWSRIVPSQCAPRAGWRMAPWGKSGKLEKAVLPTHLTAPPGLIWELNNCLIEAPRQAKCSAQCFLWILVLSSHIKTFFWSSVTVSPTPYFVILNFLFKL